MQISRRSVFLVPICVAVSFVIGSVLFAKGFLLNRVEIHYHQKCEIVGPSVMEPNVLELVYRHELVTSGQLSCDSFRRFDRAVFLVVDALRYDFTLHDRNKDSHVSKPYENKLPVINQLLNDKPHNTALLKFIADPPTTTMQRLKGLTTGSLPTFIDAGKNFASSEIAEDNIIYQMKNMGKKIIFMGDDTWESLYKQQFHRSYPFPSFNVRDLHTVDNGCIANLIPEMERHDWDIIIAHFLGVDHCGHIFGPDNPAMAEKLSQMNEVFRSVVERLDNDTILFILGDHGMTKTGDHGGDSPEEVGAALFAYSPLQLKIQTETIPHQESVDQIDLVPTVSLLLGLPIPFSSLGRLIPDFFTIPNKELSPKLDLPPETGAYLYYINALNYNVRQVKTYVETYSNRTGAFPNSFLSESKGIYQEAQSILRRLTDHIKTGDNTMEIEQGLRDAEELLNSYLDLVRETCLKIWAQFDDFSIILGVCFVFNVLFTNIMVLYQVQTKATVVLNISLQMIFIVYQWSSFWLICLEVILVAILSYLTSYVGQIARKLNDPRARSELLKGDLFTWIISVAHCLSLTSNSFVLYEAQGASFLTSSILTFVCIRTYMRTKSSGHSRRKSTLGKIPQTAVFLVIYLTASRLCQLFWSCREEQPMCDVSVFMKPLSNLRSASSRLASRRYVVSVACVLLPVFALRKWLQKQGNYDVSFLRLLGINYALPISALCISMYWALQALPSAILDALPPWQHTFLPQIGYIMMAMSLVSIFVRPVSAYFLKQEEARKIREAAKNAKHVPNSQHQSESKGRKGAKRRIPEVAPDTNMTVIEDTSNIPVVSGLGTAYSANMLQFLVTLYLLLSLLLGDGMAPALILMVVQMIVVMELGSLAETESQETQKVPYVPIWLIALWSLMSTQYFFSTGHQATIPSIRFETAFIGYHGDYPFYLYWIPAMLILLNTFASQVLFAATLPLTLLWPLTRGGSSGGSGGTSHRPQVDGLRGEMKLQNDPELFKRRLSHLVLHYLSFQALPLFGTMLAAALHRRHLMAWGIFAPRFIFQGVAFLVTLPTLLASCVFLMFSHRALGKWVQKNIP